jgi:catechol 2,3-dioxygenase-like lactoylglutathione lyase family enzyme
MTTTSPPSVRATSVTVMTPDPFGLADFYARLLGVEVVTREPAPPGAPEVAGFAQVRLPHLTLNLEYEEQWTRPVWPARAGEQTATQHLDLLVDDLEAATRWATQCGAVLADVQPQDDVRVLFDPVGHPFCLFR